MKAYDIKCLHRDMDFEPYTQRDLNSYPYCYAPYPVDDPTHWMTNPKRLGYWREADVPALKAANEQTGNPVVISHVVNGRVELSTNARDLGDFWETYKKITGEE